MTFPRDGALRTPIPRGKSHLSCPKQQSGYRKIYYLILGWVTTASTCAMVLGCSGKTLYTEMSVLTPAELLEGNDYVAACELTSAEEIAQLGMISFMDRDYDYYLMEYVFAPREMFKPKEGDSLIFLWYLSGFCRQTGGRGDLEVAPPLLTLVYGSRMPSPDSVIYVITPWIKCSMEQFLTMHEQGQVGRFQVDELDHQIVDRLSALEGLEERFGDDNSRGTVIYASDFLYGTHISFEKGKLTCGRPGTEEYRSLSSAEYLDELRKLSD